MERGSAAQMVIKPDGRITAFNLAQPTNAHPDSASEMLLAQETTAALAFDASSGKLLETLERSIAKMFVCPGVRHEIPSENT
jgi:hypothetical protein